MRALIIVVTLALTPASAAQPTDKGPCPDPKACCLELPSHPGNTPDCYKRPLKVKDVKAGDVVGGWPTGTTLHSAPGRGGTVLGKLTRAEHFGKHELRATGRRKGAFLEVDWVVFERKRQGCDDRAEVRSTVRGWVRATGAREVPLLWTWLYTGLC
jgi:hypothetical protein